MISEAWLVSADGTKVPIRGSCGLGRAPDNKVVVAEVGVSRRHALIHSQGEGEYWIVDLGSRNGSYLNGRRLAQPTRLTHGDTLQLGTKVFRFEESGGTSARHNETDAAATVANIRTTPCWLLVADVIGSTKLASQGDPREVARTIGAWLAACRDHIEKSGGAINKFLGDGFFAYWPAEYCQLDNILAALAELRQLSELSSPPFRIVIHHGEVTLGGTASMGEEDLSGLEVNFVFRMEKVAGKLGHPRMMSAQAKAAAGGALPTSEAGAHRVPSFTGEYAFHIW